MYVGIAGIRVASNTAMLVGFELSKASFGVEQHNVRVIRAVNRVCRRTTERGKLLNPEYSIFRDQPTPGASPLRINTLLSRVFRRSPVGLSERIVAPRFSPGAVSGNRPAKTVLGARGYEAPRFAVSMQSNRVAIV